MFGRWSPDQVESRAMTTGASAPTGAAAVALTPTAAGHPGYVAGMHLRHKSCWRRTKAGCLPTPIDTAGWSSESDSWQVQEAAAPGCVARSARHA